MATTNETGRCWAEINLDNLRYNFTQIRDHVKAIMPEAKVLGVVKADAYGHGAVQAATVLRDAGADFFAVATIGEGVELREAGFTLPILVLGYVGDADAALLAEYDIAAALCDTDTAKAFSRMKPDYIGLLTLMFEGDVQLRRECEEGKFHLLTAPQVAKETLLMLEHIDSEGSVFRSNHASNYLTLKGTLNRDREAMCEQIRTALERGGYKKEYFRAL